jgi:chromosome segregation ATPase
LDSHGPAELEREKHQAKMALSKAQSGASRLDVAVDAIEAEIEQLRERLHYQQIRWHVLQGETDAEAAEEKLTAGLVHIARPLFEDACEHFEQALAIARKSECTRSKQIRIRLEELRERCYDLEVDPVSEAFDSVAAAREAADAEEAIEHWRAARERYEQALDAADDEAPIRYQLTWVDANFVRACRAYASELEEDADEHMANGHEQWARQLYMAASDQLLVAGEIARESEHVDLAPIEAQYERLRTSESEGDPEWLVGAAAND